MLILSRKKNESIVIGEDEIKIVVVEIRGDKVRLGIDAPKSTPVHRREVFDAMRRGDSAVRSLAGRNDGGGSDDDGSGEGGGNGDG